MAVEPPVPSRFNGVWGTDGDAGAREGLLVHDLYDGGIVWSPLRVVLDDGGLTLMHRCRDFSVDPVSGRVVAAPGAFAAGRVTETPDGFDFAWTASTHAILVGHSNLVRRPDRLTDVRIQGVLADGSVSLRVEWLTADASVASEFRRFEVTRQFACE